MIEKMKYVNITGPRSEIDRIVSTYLSRYEIHLENALTELTGVTSLTPFTEANPYRDLLAQANLFCEEPGVKTKHTPEPMEIQEARDLVTECQTRLQEMDDELLRLKETHDQLLHPLKIIRPFRNVNYDIRKVLSLKHICYRLGRIGKQYYQKFRDYIYDNADTIFIETETDDQYVYGIYFTPVHLAKKIHAVYSSMHFEQIRIPDVNENNLSGTVTEVCDKLEKRHQELHVQMDAAKERRNAFLEEKAGALVSAREALQQASDTFDIRRMAACTEQEKEDEPFFILCGWMTESDAEAFQKDIQNDENVFCMSGDDKNAADRQPPTKLRNRGLFKPFELYIKMYGLPAYGEMDPTWFLAITYSFLFGAMFGDVGQGLLLFLGGLFLYKKKHMDLAGIISCAGVFSIFFGFMYGSLFGFEDILPALWLHPMSAMMSVPFVGRLNVVFVAAIGFGMLLILVCMVFSVLNARRNGDVEKTWFDPNAVAGLVFYGSIALTAVLLVSGHKAPAGILMVVMFILPLVVMFLKEPLTNLVEKKAKILPEQKGIFFVQSFFEMFEVLLSYLSNTLSFLRVGAFAVSHAAMMEVVLMLAGAENGGSPNWLVIILGNLFVCGMEGLIVGIQVLRLEYYEIFSRFYKGSGREFRPFSVKAGKQNK